ncbi:hypothetical protein [Microlunatus sp. GCM10028923]|uniref:hypothetical protein n=1 Tax=Microlunatus sp. GCM10028923 TaxID=3273400 RepID=UPI003610CC7F
MIMNAGSADPLLTQLDGWVRRQVEAELQRLLQRAPGLAGEAEQQIEISLARIGERLVLSPTKDWTTRFPDRRDQLAVLFAADRRQPTADGAP